MRFEETGLGIGMPTCKAVSKKKKLRKATILAFHVFASIRPRGTTRFPPEGLSLN